MASLQEIKARLNSVSTTKKITKAMQLVSTSKLQKSRKRLESIQEYYTSVNNMFQDLLSNVKDFESLIPKNSKDSTVYVVISSDIGLCGGYNSNVIKMLKNSYRKGVDKVVVFGNKGISALKARGISAYKQVSHVGDEIQYISISLVANDIVTLFQNGEINRVKVIYTKFINTVSFETAEMQLLPIEQKVVKKNDDLKSLIEFEPDPETIVKNLIPLYFSTLLFGAAIESKVSEMSSRRTAMENATNNADDLMETLSLEYNRVRQAKITQEISEIVSGSEAE